MTEDWQTGRDASRTIGDPPARVEARVQLLYGSLAEVVTPYHPSDDPIRVPAAELAEQLGVALAELAGKRFTAAIDGDHVRDARLTG